MTTDTTALVATIEAWLTDRRGVKAIATDREHSESLATRLQAAGVLVVPPMDPTEFELTAAVHAAAQTLYSDVGEPVAWDALTPAARRPFLESVLPIVTAVLGVLPDRGAAMVTQIGTYLVDDMWCHHTTCDVPAGGLCTCGLEALLDAFGEVEAL